MIEEDDARSQILAAVPNPVAERVPVGDALGRYVVEDVMAGVALPGFDNSAMDGFAVRAADAVAGANLKVIGEQPAGPDLDLQLRAGEAIRIFTGAPMPAGADAVVMQEDTERDGDCVTILEAVDSVGEFVRFRGSDLCEGQRILATGDRLSPQRIGLLASQGLEDVLVGKIPSVGVLSTGDELIEVGQPLGAGEIYDSNSVMLAALVASAVGSSGAVRRYHARDEAGQLGEVVRIILAENDVVVIAGGVSVGERDLVKQVLGECGVATDFWRVRLKPGKPFLFGRSEDGSKLVFGLPGNPVSAFVTFGVFVAPALRRWMGAREDEVMPRSQRMELGQAAENRGDRPHYVRGAVNLQSGRFFPVGAQQSHALNGLARADGLLRLDPGESLEAGADVMVFPVA